MSFIIQGTKIETAGVKATSEEVKQAAKELGIELKTGDIQENKEYTEAEITAIINQYDDTKATVVSIWNKRATFSTSKTTGNKEDKIAELKAKYPVTGAVNGDAYTMNNPEMVAFQKMMNDGVIEELGKCFSRNDVIDIIHSVFPTIGIERKTGEGEESSSYSVPYGHDDTAKDVYNQFIQKITTATGSTADIAGLEAEIKNKTNQYNANMNSIKSLSSQANRLHNEIQKLIAKAIDESKKIEARFKEDAKRTVNRELDNYVKSEGKMTYTQFQNKVTSSLRDISPTLSTVVGNLLRAENKMLQLENVVGQIGTLNTRNAALKIDIQTLTDQLEVKKTEQANQVQDVERTDPIGFVLDDGTKVDFFIDRDNDGKLSNETEFLGAKDGWKEMTDLDGSLDGVKDGKVSFEEFMNTPGLKLVITKPDGQQAVADASAIMKSGDYIDLESYQANGNTIAGTDNILSGTFDAHIGGKTLTTGYNTLDTLDYLDENYNFSDKEKGIGRFAQGEIDGLNNEKEILASDFDAIIQKDNKDLDDAWSRIGITRDELIPKLRDAYKKEAAAKAAALEPAFNRNKQKADAASSTNTGTSTSVTYEKYNASAWDDDLNKLSNETTKKARDKARNSLIKKVKEANYSPEDIATILKRIRDKTFDSMHLEWLEHDDTNSKYTNKTLYPQWDEYEQEAKAIADSKNANYEIEKREDFESRLHEIIRG